MLRHYSLALAGSVTVAALATAVSLGLLSGLTAMPLSSFPPAEVP